MHAALRLLAHHLESRLADGLARLRLPAPARGVGIVVLRSTSLGDLTVFLPFLATLCKSEDDVRLALISRADIAAVMLQGWSDRIVRIDPTSRRSLLATLAAARERLATRPPHALIYAPQNSDDPRTKLRRLWLARTLVGGRPPFTGFGNLPALRSASELAMAPAAVALNQAFAPFVATGRMPRATRAECNRLLALTDRELEEADALLCRRGGSGDGPAVAMYMHAKDARKRWPIERFVEVARALTRGSGRQLWLIGGPEDTGAARHVAAAVPRGRAVVLTDVASVRHTLALLARCTLFVGNDGSATHFAALRGCRCVTVFCNFEVPGIWEPLAAPASISIRPAWEVGRHAGDDYGIEAIGVPLVLDAIERIEQQDRIEAAPSALTAHEILTVRADGSVGAPARPVLPFPGPLV